MEFSVLQLCCSSHRGTVMWHHQHFPERFLEAAQSRPGHTEAAELHCSKVQVRSALMLRFISEDEVLLIPAVSESVPLVKCLMN